MIEQLGGYDSLKKEYEETLPLIQKGYKSKGMEIIRLLLLEHRRQHNIFEVGDSFVNYADDAIYTALSIDQNNRMHGKSGDKNVWTYFGRFGLRHATDEEIKAGRRL